MGILFSTPQKNPDRVIVFVEGNIGIGKTTLLDFLEQAGYKVYREFRDLLGAEYLENNQEKNIIELFYSDRKKYAFALQMAALHSRMQDLLEGVFELHHSNRDKEIIFMERSVLTDMNVFEPTLYEEGDLNLAEHCIYEKLSDQNLAHFTKILEPYTVVFAYLEGSAELCLERINLRARDGEEKISLDYLTELQKKHDEWLKKKSLKPFVCLDASKTVEEVSKHLITFLETMDYPE